MENSKKMLEKLAELKPFTEPLQAAVTAVEQRYTAQKQALQDRLDELSADEKSLGETFVGDVLAGKTPNYRHIDIPAETTRIEAHLDYLKGRVKPAVDDLKDMARGFESSARRVEAGLPGLKPIADRIKSLEAATATIVQQTGPGSGIDPLVGRLRRERESYAAKAMEINQELDSMDFILKQAKRIDCLNLK